jgi:hypothetical protein
MGPGRRVYGLGPGILELRLRIEGVGHTFISVVARTSAPRRPPTQLFFTRIRVRKLPIEGDAA